MIKKYNFGFNIYITLMVFHFFGFQGVNLEVAQNKMSREKGDIKNLRTKKQRV